VAYARSVTAAALVALAVGRAGWAASGCEEARGQTGLAVVSREDGLAIAAVDAGSAAARTGLRAGDGVVQANGTLLRACADWQRALREARKDRKALLVLARRGDAEVLGALAADTWTRAVATVSTLPPEPPSVRELVERPPPPLPADARVTLDGVVRALGALAPADRPPASLDAYRRDLLRVHREVETLARRGAVRTDVVEGLRTILRYHDAAEVAWDAEAALRERTRRPRHVPTAEAEPAPYFSDSEAAAVIEQFPFLRAAVAREPASGVVTGESSGSWRPVQARRLLWEHARDETGRLDAWLAAPGR